MTINPQTITNARRSRLWSQSQLLYKLDETGHRALDDDGNQFFDLDQAPAVLQNIGLPPSLTGATFATSEFSETEAVKGWFVDTLNSKITDQDVDRLVLLIGDGSNYIAAAVLRNAVKQGLTVAWYDWHDFTKRYTDGIERSRMFDAGLAEEMAMAAQESEDARDEDFNLRYVYEVLVITDFNVHAVRDFAVADITSMFRNRPDWGLITIITAAEPHSTGLEEKHPDALGRRGALLRQFEHEAKVFDAS